MAKYSHACHEMHSPATTLPEKSPLGRTRTDPSSLSEMSFNFALPGKVLLISQDDAKKSIREAFSGITPSHGRTGNPLMRASQTLSQGLHRGLLTLWHLFVFPGGLRATTLE